MAILYVPSPWQPHMQILVSFIYIIPYKMTFDRRHYLIVSAVTNLLVNLLGVWFFRSYARVNIGMLS